ncbi:MAG: GMC family oxidoreductase [Alphaproteobacteria bacterium TMED89]|nr:GMC family oxidoreductase [Rhodospirillaceae bacterium]RPH14180.1 MAG: GMC family oxidoreductase [Alphaproteobacteria bacterium TMED89]
MEFDYVIVGAGSAGCVLANRLSADPTVTVCLIEAGGRARNPAIHLPFGLAVLGKFENLSWGYNIAPQTHMKGRQPFWPRGKVLGGSSSVNAMIYARGMRADYDGWAAMGATGWDFDSVLPYFLKAEDNARGADELHGVGGPLGVSDPADPNPLSLAFVEAGQQTQLPLTRDFNRGEDVEGIGLYQTTTRRGLRASAARSYLSDAVQARPNLHIMTQQQVQRLTVEDRRATGVELGGGAAGQTRQVRARREVLLSAGAINSPQVLMLSGIGPADHVRAMGIPVVLDAPGVGQGLADHLDVIIQHKATTGKGLGFEWDLGFRLARWGAQWVSRRGGALASNVAEAGGFAKSSPDRDIPDIQFHFLPARIEDHGRTWVWGYGFCVHCCNLYPKSTGEVRLASPDPMAKPVIDPKYLSDPEGHDLDVLMSATRWGRKLLGAPAFDAFRGEELSPGAGIQTREQVREWVLDTADTVYHPTSTVAMGAADNLNAPLMPDLQVKGVEGLRVVDASVMPRLIGGNTNAPTIMIAEKAADMIRSTA